MHAAFSVQFSDRAARTVKFITGYYLIHCKNLVYSYVHYNAPRGEPSDVLIYARGLLEKPLFVYTPVTCLCMCVYCAVERRVGIEIDGLFSAWTIEYALVESYMDVQVHENIPYLSTTNRLFSL